MNTNAAFKTGNRKFYSILQGGLNWGQTDEKVYSFGYGLGSEMYLGKTFSINPEISGNYLYLGSWDYWNILSKFNLNLNIRLGKYVSIFGGPSFNVYYTDQHIPIHGYKPPLPPAGFNDFNMGTGVNGWIGWNVGINLF
jgi:hypothetical protein